MTRTPIAAIIAGATPSLRRRIAAKTQTPGRGRRGCWIWIGGYSEKRRGQRRPVIQVGRRGTPMQLVTRIMLAITDRVPLAARSAAKLEAGHTCGDIRCVNPRHLVWQTRTENEREKADRRAYETVARAVDALAEDHAYELHLSDQSRL